jgi:hypothetical protein
MHDCLDLGGLRFRHCVDASELWYAEFLAVHRDGFARLAESIGELRTGNHHTVPPALKMRIVFLHLTVRRTPSKNR